MGSACSCISDVGVPTAGAGSTSKNTRVVTASAAWLAALRAAVVALDEAPTLLLPAPRAFFPRPPPAQTTVATAQAAPAPDPTHSGPASEAPNGFFHRSGGSATVRQGMGPQHQHHQAATTGWMGLVAAAAGHAPIGAASTGGGYPRPMEGGDSKGPNAARWWGELLPAPVAAIAATASAVPRGGNARSGPAYVVAKARPTADADIRPHQRSGKALEDPALCMWSVRRTKAGVLYHDALSLVP
jgi:hypothetical protein